MNEKYVKLSAVKKKLNYIYRTYGVSQRIKSTTSDALEKIPYTMVGELELALEAEPVKHGKWRTSKSEGLPTDRFVCSECNGLVIVSTYRNNCLYNYCPNCGAKMDEEVKK